MKKQLNILLVLISVLAVVLIVNSVLTGSLNKEVSKSIADAKELARPADIELTIITDQQCAKCSDVKSITDSIKVNNNVKSENTVDFRLPEAQGLIRDYGIEKIPSVIVKGELDKAKLNGFETKEDAMVLKDIGAPYTSVLDGKIKGLVELTYLQDSDCDKCFDFTSAIQQLKQSIVIDKETLVEFDSEDGKSLIKKYNLNKVPAIVLSPDFSFYPVAESWQQLGSIEEDGNYVLESVNPPFINMTTKKLVGLVELTYLTDDSCEGCYDVTTHKKILQGYGVNPVKEKTFDVSSPEGEALIKEYNITKVPTIILSEDASHYAALNQVWQQVGSVVDGKYVFTGTELMGKYRDLTTGKVVG